MDALRVAIDAARAAGALLVEYGARELAIEEKGARGDLVTAADRASESLIIAHLREATPFAAIVGEEGGTVAGSSDERWIVDPLDGTTNFAHRYPLYCVSIAYEVAGRLTCGVIFAPVLGELYAAQAGLGAMCNGRAIEVSDVPTVRRALACTGFKPADYARNGAQFGAVSRVAQGVRRDGSAALDLAFVACGRFDAFWEFDLAPWDVAAGALIIAEAGGRVTAVDGGSFAVDGESILASNGRVHDEMVRTLALGA